MSEFFEGLAEIFEVDVSKISSEFELHSGEAAWDSLAIVSTIALADDCFNVMLEGKALGDCQTIADIEKLGLMREFVSGVFDRDVYDALWRLGQEKPDLTGLSPQAVQLAEIVNKYQTTARNRRNRFGAWIRDLQGYITRQSHDMFKIREATDAEWVDFVKDKLDLFYSRMFTTALRLFGLDVVVEFRYADIDLRPEADLAAFRQTQQMMTLEKLSLGLITDEEASLTLTGKLPPSGYKPLSGTMFHLNKGGQAADTQEPTNGGSTLNQNLNGDTPAVGRGQNKKAEVVTLAVGAK